MAVFSFLKHSQLAAHYDAYFYIQGMQGTDAVSLLFTQALVICRVSYFS